MKKFIVNENSIGYKLYEIHYAFTEVIFCLLILLDIFTPVKLTTMGAIGLYSCMLVSNIINIIIKKHTVKTITAE